MEKGFQGLEGQELPEMTDEFVNLVSERYIELYEIIVGEKFIKEDTFEVADRIEKNVTDFIHTYYR
jgi:phosphoribosylaminoimidazole-succinocarboxamide synthase